MNSILRVAFLAPEITEAIIDGRQPPDLTLGSLTGVLPMSWQQQKKLISFPQVAGRDRGARTADSPHIVTPGQPTL
jgi:hypothetical protein